MGAISRNVDTTGAGQSRDDFFFRAGIHAQILGQQLALFLGHHSAFTGKNRTVNDGLGKAQAGVYEALRTLRMSTKKQNTLKHVSRGQKGSHTDGDE